MRLFHVSDTPSIEALVPRPSNIAPELGPVVWAIDFAHLPNYLLSRECPRVTFAAVASTSDEHRTRFGIGNGRVVVIERRWLDLIIAATIYEYELPPDAFTFHDA